MTRTKTFWETVSISEQDVEEYKKVIFCVLSTLTRDQIVQFRKNIRIGKFNGWIAQGERCDFWGTLEMITGIPREELLRKPASPADRRKIDYWFKQICNPGIEIWQQTHENNSFVARTIEWCDEMIAEKEVLQITIDFNKPHIAVMKDTDHQLVA